MKTEDFKLTDIHRIFIGDVPGEFFIEVVIRTILIYFLLILAIRLMGKRMALQLNVTELTAMVALAAAIGVPMQAPDRGILPAAVIAVVVVLAERSITRFTLKSQTAETVFHGDMNVLIEDAVINYQCLKDVSMSKSLVLQQLRSQGIDHLGEVKRLYMESSGAFSLVKYEETQPGLSVVPDGDEDYWESHEVCTEIYVCSNCGNKSDSENGMVKDQIQEKSCEKCGEKAWEQAVR
jgi:uncharacterized membrane protein YcaP (DUF421 family)